MPILKGPYRDPSHSDIYHNPPGSNTYWAGNTLIWVLHLSKSCPLHPGIRLRRNHGHQGLDITKQDDDYSGLQSEHPVRGGIETTVQLLTLKSR